VLETEGYKEKAMSGPPPAAIRLTSQQQNILERIVRRHTSSQRLVRRTRIILLANSGLNNEQIAQQLGISRVTVQLWRQRWHELASKLAVLEQEGIDDKALMEWSEGILIDQQRRGAPATFSIEQVVQIIALACEDPQASTLPITDWTPRELATEAMKRGIVESISPRSVERFLKRGRLTAPSESLLAQR
jgi:putative transposase